MSPAAIFERSCFNEQAVMDRQYHINKKKIFIKKTWMQTNSFLFFLCGMPYLTVLILSYPGPAIPDQKCDTDILVFTDTETETGIGVMIYIQSNLYFPIGKLNGERH